MVVFLSSTEINRVYVGSTEVKKAFLGATPVFDKTVVLPSVPLNTASPSISGSTAIPATLSVETGTWTGYPTPIYTYQWQRNGTTISGATAATYDTVADDDGAKITCIVTATNSEGSVTADSNALTVSIAPATSGLTWPATVLTAHVGWDAAISAVEWRDDSGQGNHMALVGAPVVVQDGAARAVRFDGSSQYGAFAANAYQKTDGRFNPVNIAVTAKFPRSRRNKALIGDAGTNGHIIISDSNSTAAVVNNVDSVGSISIGDPTEANGLSGATAIVDGVDDSITISALQTPDRYQTIIIRQAVLGPKWTIPHLFERRGSRRWNASAVAVTVWSGTDLQDEIDIVGNHWKATEGDVEVQTPAPAEVPLVTGTDNTRIMEYSATQVIPLPEGTVAGQPVLAALYVHGSETSVSAPPGWRLVERVNASSNTWMDVFSGLAVDGQTSVALTLGAMRDASGTSLALASGVVGKSAFSSAPPGSVIDPPEVVIDAHGTALTFIVFSGKNVSYVSSKEAGLVHDPANKTFAKMGLVTWIEGEAGPTSTEISYSDYPYYAVGAITVGMEAAASADMTPDVISEFEVGAP
ncbi:hypothetical protein QO034_15855 [Sedimentitalea sp. JM2-8]|uniref:Ig-like domain-containing protein n=1 Tax=Sedimentitalea xiamensis TaxID=3050037 RepID=A0ABT7FHV4_9RHOB|nr:hypothetical protein [Sedimentitalea xiamensis]MDK3074570.1 hypothetical protein [Sedimentitalea xiamensis]